LIERRRRFFGLPGRSKRAIEEKQNDEVDRSGRRHAGANSQRDQRPAPEGGYPGFQAEAGDRTYSERRRLHPNFKATDEEGHKVLRVYLKYGNNNEAVISNVARVSRPGCRVYVRRTEIPRVLGGMGINILTTPRGVMTGRQARKEGLGGEVLCEVW
jgi:hypothetical protein